MFILSWCAGCSCCSLLELNIPSRNKAEIGATSFACLQYSAFMQLIMVHWCGGFGDEQCWVVPWTPNEDFVCITSHARSTAATSFTCAVTSDGVHLIMVCWVLLLQSFGAEHPLPQQSRDRCHVLRLSTVFCFHAAYHGALVRRFWG